MNRVSESKRSVHLNPFLENEIESSIYFLGWNENVNNTMWLFNNYYFPSQWKLIYISQWEKYQRKDVNEPEMKNHDDNDAHIDLYGEKIFIFFGKLIDSIKFDHSIWK